MTAKEAQTSGEVVTGKITVHSKPVLALFDFGASHCYISDSFTTLHSIPVECLHNQWAISTGNGVVISNRICIDCPVELCNRTLAVDMLILDTRGYDVILGMTWLSKYHGVIDCQNKKIIFKIAEFQFDGEHKSAKRKAQMTIAEIQKKGVPFWNEFLDVFKEISRLPPDRAVEFSVDTILGIVQYLKLHTEWCPLS